MNEPSILDYLKSRLNPRQKEKIHIPGWDQSVTSIELDGNTQMDGGVAPVELSINLQPADIPIPARSEFRWPWRILLAIAFSLIAQAALERPAGSLVLSIVLYFLALTFLGWAYYEKEFDLPGAGEVISQDDPRTYHRNSLILAFVLSFVAFLLFSNNLFTTINVSIWLTALILFVRSFWLVNVDQPTFFQRFLVFFRRDSWQVSITRWTVLVVVVAVVVLFYRFYRLSGVPGEPFSDHAEKLLDVYDVTQGQTHIFFPRNTGREFLQFYLTAAIATWLGTGISFISLKIGTVLIGLLALPYIYLIGKELGGKRVAIFALLLAGTSYWLNVISRIGLRFPLYPAFAAPALYHFIRGMRRHNRNDFILSGLFLGLGLHGYSPYRFVPVVLLLGLAIYLLHKQSEGKRSQTVMLFTILVIASVLVFLPLLRYSLENPEMFSYRALTRLTGQEKPLDGPVWQIFASNTFNAMMMFNVDNGEIWVHSIPNRPALDVVSAVLFLFGYLFLFWRYLMKRDWLDLFVFLSVPMLLMPSILSLAFPSENPSLNRTGAAAVVVFVVAAMALEGIYTALQSRSKSLASIVVTGLLIVACFQNYNLVFDQFTLQFMRGAWNTSDMGRVIRAFALEGNDPNNVFVIPYPYWVDTRLVGIQAGYPTKDYAIWRDDLPKTQAQTGSKLFIFKEEDTETANVLRQIYPSGLLGHFESALEGKSFWIYTVPEQLLVTP